MPKETTDIKRNGERKALTVLDGIRIILTIIS